VSGTDEVGAEAGNAGAVASRSGGLWLLGLALVAAGLALVVTRLLVAPAKRAPVVHRGAALVSLAPAAIRDVEIRRDRVAFHFTWAGGRWVAAAGQEGSGQEDQVAEFLDTLAGLDKLLEVAGEGATLADFGLAPPRAEVVLRNGDEVRIVLGDRNPAATGVYVQLPPDRRIFLVGGVLQWEVDKLAPRKTAQTEQ
jgi:hypothetical protein